eukprot:Plantae.Rhodophyta-Purpureofilum_apyrenoidigerum.ctg28124.p1 GENE.Plantae.Rhodophyta-Purpureofilum_apyrenoidigerum.ctg28124~~Plantae.Rhodophyta-Purpureofilum_apyrenoidigerum.ctg28124.p1  ORF type:complete len:245 (+),score=9.34 Plantae.Rhodophyta-Purpureofilum_apyrenoidigerum.ctg28124:519-1253(+)
MGAKSSRHQFPLPSSHSISENTEQDGRGMRGFEGDMNDYRDIDEGHQSSYDSDALVSTTFSWNLGGHSVYVTGAWDQWQSRHPMFKVGSEFSAVLPLPLGTFQYKYIVDGEWRSHNTQPTECDEHGNLNNVVKVAEFRSAFDPDDPPAASGPLSPLETYDNSVPGTDVLRMSEVLDLPAHYREPVLNKERAGGRLLVPNHVCVNHLHTATRHFEDENVTVLGITKRWRDKFVTTVIYSPRSDPE